MLKINHNYKSPNFADEIIKPEYIILHCMCMPDTQALEFLCAEVNGVSAHYYISRRGKIYNLVADNKKAWHAGDSRWKGIDQLNPHSIGIELGNRGTLGNEGTYTKSQYKALILLLEDIANRYNIKPENILAHSDIAPERKTDPGVKFHWQTLIDTGLVKRNF